MDPRFLAGLPFPVPEVLEFVAFRDSEKIVQQFSQNFPELSCRTPAKTPETATAFSSFLIVCSKESMIFCPVFDALDPDGEVSSDFLSFFLKSSQCMSYTEQLPPRKHDNPQELQQERHHSKIGSGSSYNGVHNIISKSDAIIT